MTLKELIKLDFGVELPISGGFGNSLTSPIIIHRIGINDYIGTETFILKCLGKGRGIEWKILSQELQHDNEAIIDKIKIETIELTENESITQIENYYFDITECFGNEVRQDKTFDEKWTLKQIKERIIKLEMLNDFNKKCIGLLRTEELFKDTNTTLIIDFLNIIRKDESLPLFESMMENKRKPIMDVLRIIGKELNENS